MCIGGLFNQLATMPPLHERTFSRSLPCFNGGRWEITGMELAYQGLIESLVAGVD
jgi:hypothetical protein